MKGPKQKAIISLEIVAYWDYSFIYTSSGDECGCI